MSLLDKVPGELNLYIGGYVLHAYLERHKVAFFPDVAGVTPAFLCAFSRNEAFG